MSNLAKNIFGILIAIVISLVISLPIAFVFSIIPNAHIIVVAQYLGLDPHTYSFIVFEAVFTFIFTLSIIANAKRH